MDFTECLRKCVVVPNVLSFFYILYASLQIILR